MTRDEFFRVVGAVFREPYHTLSDVEKELVWSEFRARGRLDGERLEGAWPDDVMLVRDILQRFRLPRP